jgi:hypothetical protein
MRRVKIPLKQIAGGPQCAQPPSPHEPNLEMAETIMRKYFWPFFGYWPVSSF